MPLSSLWNSDLMTVAVCGIMISELNNCSNSRLTNRLLYQMKKKIRAWTTVIYDWTAWTTWQ